jgi:hypothetical protein
MLRIAVIFGLWLLQPPACQAQSPSDVERFVVVVGSREVAGVIERLARSIVEVRALSVALAGEADGEAQNRRVIALRSATALLHDSDDNSTTSALWKERLETHGVRSVCVCSPTNHSVTEACVRQAHAALLQLFPDERAILDERLQIELLRLRQSPGAPFFVSAE